MSSSGFLGSGWRFPLMPDTGHELPLSATEDNIRESIWIILATAPGERIMRPDFGCGLYELVFALNDAATTGRVIKVVRDALIRWEPRIDVLGVEVETRGRDGEVLLINIHYRVRSTNNFFNLVYPFYLAGTP